MYGVPQRQQSEVIQRSQSGSASQRHVWLSGGNGSWSAKSINDDDWDLRKLAVVRLPTDSDQKWRNNQFHALHDQRVRLAPGMKGCRRTPVMFELPQLPESNRQGNTANYLRRLPR